MERTLTAAYLFYSRLNAKDDRLAEVYEVMKQTGMSYGDILLYGAEQFQKEGAKKAEVTSP